ncbi:hypothetical protein [Fimbriiglobus ruber]|uniref:Transmembrane protein n=1 Tax=Fimbriiglobus ruber TaxID=1908690 RepID=A0A225ECR6_9BACT|nr:hypothetical protein [Fimbriiglobus ruber]OWK47139.1 hypothetical protein FRUB_00838 [Fimbriiglobus ruber]
MKRLLFAAVVVVCTAFSVPQNAMAGCCRGRCSVPEDPAVVAAREKETQARDKKLAIAGGIGLSVFVVFIGVNFVREAKLAAAATQRPRQPWDVDL